MTVTLRRCRRVDDDERLQHQDHRGVPGPRRQGRRPVRGRADGAADDGRRQVRHAADDAARVPARRRPGGRSSPRWPAPRRTRRGTTTSSPTRASSSRSATSATARRRRWSPATERDRLYAEQASRMPAFADYEVKAGERGRSRWSPLERGVTVGAGRADAVDAVVVGGGPNGLVAALRIALAGRSVTVFEAHDTVGGGCRSAELTLPGFVHDRCATVHTLGAASPIFGSLDLERHGRALRPPGDRAGPSARRRARRAAPPVARRAPSTASATTAAPGGGSSVARSATGTRVVASVLQPLLRVPRHPLAMASFGLRAVPPATWVARTFAHRRGRGAVRRLRGALVPAARPPAQRVVRRHARGVGSCGRLAVRRRWVAAAGRRAGRPTRSRPAARSSPVAR